MIETPGGVFVAAASASRCATTIPEMCSLRVTPGPDEEGVSSVHAAAALAALTPESRDPASGSTSRVFKESNLDHKPVMIPIKCEKDAYEEVKFAGTGKMK